MNNNYLILGLVLFFGILYYCFSSSLTVTENFQSSGSDADAINTLAQLARQLISSTGATVPGSLTVQGNTTVGGTITTGTITTGTGNLNVNTSRENGKYNTRVGSIWNHGGVYGENGALELGSQSTQVYIGSSSGSANQNLIVTGNLSGGGLNIAKGTASPDWTKIQFGDGTGWRVRYQKDDANPLMDITDRGDVVIKRNLTTNNGMITSPIKFKIYNNQENRGDSNRLGFVTANADDKISLTYGPKGLSNENLYWYMNGGRVFSALYPTKCWTIVGNVERSSSNPNSYVKLREFEPGNNGQIFGYSNYHFLHQQDFSNNWGYLCLGTDSNNFRSLNLNDGGAGAWNQWIQCA